MSTTAPDTATLELLDDTLRRTMRSTPSGARLDSALIELGWHDMLDEMPRDAIRLVFRALGETGSHAPILNDVVLRAMDLPVGSTIPLPVSGGHWISWDRTDATSGAPLDGELPIRRVGAATDIPLAAGRRALAWWLVGSARAMLTSARQHAMDRHQFGRPIASFQAVRHRLAETLVAIEGAEATLAFAEDDLGAAFGKAASGQAALTAARHCQQVFGGIGFTDEHDLHRHIRRVLTLDALLGSTRDLTKEVGAITRGLGSAPRIAQLTPNPIS